MLICQIHHRALVGASSITPARPAGGCGDPALCFEEHPVLPVGHRRLTDPELRQLLYLDIDGEPCRHATLDPTGRYAHQRRDGAPQPFELGLRAARRGGTLPEYRQRAAACGRRHWLDIRFFDRMTDEKRAYRRQLTRDELWGCSGLRALLLDLPERSVQPLLCLRRRLTRARLSVVERCIRTTECLKHSPYLLDFCRHRGLSFTILDGYDIKRHIVC